MHDHESTEEHSRNYGWLKSEWREYRLSLRPKPLLGTVTRIREQYESVEMLIQKCLTLTSYTPWIMEFKAGLLAHVLSPSSPGQDVQLNDGLREIEVSETAAQLMKVITRLGVRGEAKECCQQGRRVFATAYGHLLVALILPFVFHGRLELKARTASP